MNGLPLLIAFPSDQRSIQLIGEELEWTQEEREIAGRLFERNLPPLATPKCLPFLLGVSPRLIMSMGKFQKTYYRYYQIKKASGGYRPIEAPRRFLKLIQRWIYDHILSSAKCPDYVVGFVKGKNIFTNARFHAGSRNIMILDIKDFFPSVELIKIASVFSRIGYPASVAFQLASLCSLKGRLPQGAPTSPAIANLSFLEADRELMELARNWNCVYSRYADDIAISGPRLFSRADIEQLSAILRNHGFSPNEGKSRMIGPGGRKIIAGLVVNERPMPPRRKRRLWRAIFHRAKMHPREFLDKIQTLNGIASFVNQYDINLSNYYREVIARINQ